MRACCNPRQGASSRLCRVGTDCPQSNNVFENYIENLPLPVDRQHRLNPWQVRAVSGCPWFVIERQNVVPGGWKPVRIIHIELNDFAASVDLQHRSGRTADVPIPFIGDRNRIVINGWCALNAAPGLTAVLSMKDGGFTISANRTHNPAFDIVDKGNVTEVGIEAKADVLAMELNIETNGRCRVARSICGVPGWERRIPEMHNRPIITHGNDVVAVDCLDGVQGWYGVSPPERSHCQRLVNFTEKRASAIGNHIAEIPVRARDPGCMRTSWCDVNGQQITRCLCASNRRYRKPATIVGFNPGQAAIGAVAHAALIADCPHFLNRIALGTRGQRHIVQRNAAIRLY